MNRFMYLSKRKFSNDIKSFYPKCVNCINFNDENKTCKKFIIKQNYVDANSEHELAVIVRNDNTKCGEEGKLFDIGKEELEKYNHLLFKGTCSWTLATGVLSVVTNESILILPTTLISLLSLTAFIYQSRIYDERVKNEKKRIEDYNNFLNKSKQ